MAKEMKYNEKDALRAVQIIFEKASNARKINKGFSHDIYEVETGSYPQKVVVRFSNQNPEQFSLGKEIRVNKLLQNLGLPVPRIILYDKTKKIVPYGFVIMSKLDGEDLDELWNKLSKKEQIQIAEKIGEMLGKIHSVKFDKFGMLLPEGIKDDGSFSLKKVGTRAESNAASFQILSDGFSDLGKFTSYRSVNPRFVSAVADYFVKNKFLSETDEGPTLTHGDYYSANFRVKKIKGKWFITGVTDFEYAAVGIREYDFIKLARNGFLDKGHVRDAILRGYQKYQEIDEDFDKKVEYFRNMRDIGFAQVLLRSGDIEFLKKILGRIKDSIRFNGEVFTK